MTSNEPETAPITTATLNRPWRSRTTIAPEHMAEWERLTRAGTIHLYDYEPGVGYVQRAAAIVAYHQERVAPRAFVYHSPIPTHGTAARYELGDRCQACIAAAPPVVEGMRSDLWPFPATIEEINEATFGVVITPPTLATYIPPNPRHGLVAWLGGCACAVCAAAGAGYIEHGGAERPGALGG